MQSIISGKQSVMAGIFWKVTNKPVEIHQMTNTSNESVEFVVISMPKSHGDKENVTL